MDDDPIPPGSRVAARYRGEDEWFLGTLAAVTADGRYDVAYDDGDEDRALSPHLVRPYSDEGDAGSSAADALADRDREIARLQSQIAAMLAAATAEDASMEVALTEAGTAAEAAQAAAAEAREELKRVQEQQAASPRGAGSAALRARCAAAEAEAEKYKEDFEELSVLSDEAYDILKAQLSAKDATIESLRTTPTPAAPGLEAQLAAKDATIASLRLRATAAAPPTAPTPDLETHRRAASLAEDRARRAEAVTRDVESAAERKVRNPQHTHTHTLTTTPPL